MRNYTPLLPLEGCKSDTILSARNDIRTIVCRGWREVKGMIVSITLGVMKVRHVERDDYDVNFA